MMELFEREGEARVVIVVTTLIPRIPARQLHIQNKGSAFFVQLAAVLCVLDVIISIRVVGHLPVATTVRGYIPQAFVKIPIHLTK